MLDETRSSCPGRTFTLGGPGKRLEQQHRGVGTQGVGDELGKGGCQTMHKETGEMGINVCKMLSVPDRECFRIGCVNLAPGQNPGVGVVGRGGTKTWTTLEKG